MTAPAGELSGGQWLGASPSRAGTDAFHAVDPRAGTRLEPAFVDATRAEIEDAGARAGAVAGAVRRSEPRRRARLLRELATRLESDAARIIDRADRETALGAARLEGELARTGNQLRLFAELVEEGSWVAARIDTALPERKPLPRPDLRRMLIAVGPVAVFGASNFPLAFSVAGGDTASALAAGCPVIVKAHPSHPGTSELVARHALAAVTVAGLPDGTFQMLQGRSNEVGAALVAHPAVAAVGFTGSFGGGTSLMRIASERPTPIPVFAEMGSINPVILLPGVLQERAEVAAEAIAASVTLGVGQFCTKPGVVLVPRGDGGDAFALRLAATVSKGGGPMLNEGILRAYRRGAAERAAGAGVRIVAAADGADQRGRPVVHEVDAATFVAQPSLREELFGPAALLVRFDDPAELPAAIETLPGALTITLHLARGAARAADERLARELLPLLAERAGRVIVDGVPTGVEVSHAMQHGGPWPATSDARATSVGTAAPLRFARPVCYQDLPQALLPEELVDGNPLGIWRLIDGSWTREPVRQRP